MPRTRQRQRHPEIVSKKTFAFHQNVSFHKHIYIYILYRFTGVWVRHKDIDSPIKITVVDCEWHVREEIRLCSHTQTHTHTRSGSSHPLSLSLEYPFPWVTAIV